MRNSEKEKRIGEAVKHLIGLGLIDGKHSTKSIALRLNRNPSNISSALRGDERYFNPKFVRDFCGTYGNIISENWLCEGKGNMLAEKKSLNTPQVIQDKDYVEDNPYQRLLKLKGWLEENEPKCKNNESEVLRRLGLGTGYFSTSERQGNNSLRQNTYKKISEAFPQVNLDWLKTGDGDMFKEPVIIETEPTSGVPYYDVDFLGGFNEVVNDQTAIPAYFINFHPYNKRGNMWCNITGDSMSPRINSGDKICIREISKEEIIYGEIYALVIGETEIMRTVKWVIRSPEYGMIRLIPENKDPRYGDYQDIRISDIRNVFKVVGAIRSF